MDEWTEQAVCVHTHVRAHTQDSSLKRKEIVPLVKTWVDLEGIILSEMSQRKRNTIGSHRWDLKAPNPEGPRTAGPWRAGVGATVKRATEDESPNLRLRNDSVPAVWGTAG